MDSDAATRLRTCHGTGCSGTPLLFEACDVYRVVARMPRDVHPTDPEDLPRVVLGLSGVTTAEQMRAELTILLPLVEACETESRPVRDGPCYHWSRPAKTRISTTGIFGRWGDRDARVTEKEG